MNLWPPKSCHVLAWARSFWTVESTLAVMQRIKLRYHAWKVNVVTALQGRYSLKFFNHPFKADAEFEDAMWVFQLLSFLKYSMLNFFNCDSHGGIITLWVFKGGVKLMMSQAHFIKCFYSFTWLVHRAETREKILHDLMVHSLTSWIISIQLLDRCSDGMRFGRLLPCEECSGGQLVYRFVQKPLRI